MDYEKKYNAALEQAKKELETCGSIDCDAARQIFRFFPELQEIKDKRIVEALIRHLTVVENNTLSINCVPMCEILAYLEKQKEQKPLTPEEKVKHPLYVEGFEAGKEVGTQVETLKHIHIDWSEEDKMHLANAILAAEKEWGIDSCTANFLKSLRPQPHTVSIKNATKFGNLEYERGVKDGIQNEKNRQWKPSEEQMDALFTCTSVGSFGHREALKSLYNDLKKL